MNSDSLIRQAMRTHRVRIGLAMMAVILGLAFVEPLFAPHAPSALVCPAGSARNRRSGSPHVTRRYRIDRQPAPLCTNRVLKQ